VVAVISAEDLDRPGIPLLVRFSLAAQSAFFDRPVAIFCLAIPRSWACPIRGTIFARAAGSQPSQRRTLKFITLPEYFGP